MPLNIPTGSTSDISFGPAILFLGISGATPLVDVGFISEDGVSLEITNETKDIMQGNPKLIEYSFSQTQGVTVSLSSIEWDFDNFTRAIGAGVTTGGPPPTTFSFGGDPLLTTVAIHIQHQMAVSGNTLNAYIWKAVSESGYSIALGADEHTFEYKWKAMRSTTDWASGPLASDVQLIKIERET